MANDLIQQVTEKVSMIRNITNCYCRMTSDTPTEKDISLFDYQRKRANNAEKNNAGLDPESRAGVAQGVGFLVLLARYSTFHFELQDPTKKVLLDTHPSEMHIFAKNALKFATSGA